MHLYIETCNTTPIDASNAADWATGATRIVKLVFGYAHTVAAKRAAVRSDRNV